MSPVHIFHHQVYHVVVKLLEDSKREMQRVCFLKHQRTTTDLSTLKHWISSPLLLLIWPGYNVFHNVQNLILKVVQGLDYEAELKCVANFYTTDFNYELLRTQLEILRANFTPNQTSVKITDVTEFFKAMTPVQRELLSEVCQLFQLLLVIPATNAVSERSFSALRRVKMYLRSTMAQDWLNHIMALHIHQGLTDDLSLINSANRYIYSWK